MAKIISIFNQKGGVGKTTTAINLSASLASKDKKILLIDMDPQGNASSGLGLTGDSNYVYEVLISKLSINDAIKETSAKGVDILASNRDLAGLEIELAKEGKWNHLLKNTLEEIRGKYDFIFIDCPPSLGILSTMSLLASDSVLIPIQTEYYALEGLGHLYKTIDMVKKRLNKNLELEGILLTMYDSRTKLSEEVAKEVEVFFPNEVYKTYIPRNVSLAEAPSHGLSIIDYKKGSKGARAYLELSEEFLNKKR